MNVDRLLISTRTFIEQSRIERGWELLVSHVKVFPDGSHKEDGSSHYIYLSFEPDHRAGEIINYCGRAYLIKKVRKLK